MAIVLHRFHARHLAQLAVGITVLTEVYVRHVQGVLILGKANTSHLILPDVKQAS